MSWAIAHGVDFVELLVGFTAGVVFAAHRQLEREKLARWVRKTRSV